jgi:hypothetical protein
MDERDSRPDSATEIERHPGGEAWIDILDITQKLKAGRWLAAGVNSSNRFRVKD